MNFPISRRRLLLGFGATTALALSGCGSDNPRPLDTTNTLDFVNPLRIPPLAESTLDAAGRRLFTLRAQAGTTEFLVGKKTKTWGFNDAYLGPTLRAKRGEEVGIAFSNALPEATTIHWHGMHLPAAMDGGPHQSVAAGQDWSPRWKIDQPAATLWYHPHPHGQTEAHINRGLAGLFLIDDESSAALDLPKEYGVDDIPLIVQDRSFDTSGQFNKQLRAPIGLIGNTVLVNGTIAPYLDVGTNLLRLRLLNGSTARSYNFGLSDGRDFALIATDGGLLAAPVPLTTIQLSPGERAEIVVSMQPGALTILRALPHDLGVSASANVTAGGGDTFDLLQLRPATTLRGTTELPRQLGGPTAPDLSNVAATRSFALQNRKINGKSMDMNRVDTVVTAGTTEVWEIRNDDDQAHNFHIHDVQFGVFEIDGRRPPVWLSGWKDTIFLPPQRTVRLVVPFGHYADPKTPYMYHCHLIWHGDQDMMGQFVVVVPGQAVDVPAGGVHIGH